jgi:hypothetical protein
MNVNLYYNENKTRLLILPQGKEISSLPESGQEFAKGLTGPHPKDIIAEQQLIALNTEETIESINSKGYYAINIDYKINFQES